MDIKKLQKFIDSVNIADLIDQETLDKLGARVVRDYDIDCTSRHDLDVMNEKAMELAKQVYEQKTFPWPDAANVKYPLITTSAIQFASRAMPELIPDEKIVNIRVFGEDPDKEKEKRGDRVSGYMDYQLTQEMDDWLGDMDRMFHVLPIIGDCFKKPYYDGVTGKVCSEFLTLDDVVVNAKAKCLKSARVITHRFYKYENYYLEMVAAGVWSKIELGQAADEKESGEEDPPHFFLEQHRWFDLDGDGYEEPYIVTVHHQTGKVLRIVARYDADSLKIKNGKLIRIEPDLYFTRYPFIPNPSGGFYHIGFGSLLTPINESINTTINQLLDAGTLANSGGGFIARGVNLGSGAVSFQPGEWKNVPVMGNDLRAGIMPLPIREPSQVLFSLLGLLVTAGKDISSVQEAMTGQKPGENVSLGTVAALIEQGLKVFNGIYKRIYRSMTEEFKMIYKLNSKYMDFQRYIEVLDDKLVKKEDFSLKGLDIIPAAEPVFSLETQRVMRTEALMKVSGRPGLDEDAITQAYLRAIKAPKEMFVPPEKRPAALNPDIERLKLDQEKWQSDRKTAELQRLKIFAEIEALRAKAVQMIADAEAKEAGVQLEQYRAFIEELGVRMEGLRNEDSSTGGPGGMEAPPSNGGTIPASPGDQGAAQ